MKKKLTSAVCLFLAMSIFAVSCSQKQEVTPSNSTSADEKSGEELYRALFFLEGDFAKEIPTYAPHVAKNEQKQGDTPELVELKETIIEGIKVNQPSFFEEFKTEIESKDYDRIQAALSKGKVVYVEAGLKSEKFGPAFAALLDVSKSVDLSKIDFSTDEGQKQVQDLFSKSVANGSSSSDEGACVALAGFFVVAAAIWEVAVAVNVAAVGSVVYWVAAVGEVLDSDGGETSRTGSLYNEKLVAEIADAI